MPRKGGAGEGAGDVDMAAPELDDKECTDGERVLAALERELRSARRRLTIEESMSVKKHATFEAACSKMEQLQAALEQKESALEQKESALEQKESALKVQSASLDKREALLKRIYTDEKNRLAVAEAALAANTAAAEAALAANTAAEAALAVEKSVLTAQMKAMNAENLHLEHVVALAWRGEHLTVHQQEQFETFAKLAIQIKRAYAEGRSPAGGGGAGGGGAGGAGGAGAGGAGGAVDEDHAAAVREFCLDCCDTDLED